MKTLHACRVCVTGHYIDEDRMHGTFCGLWLPLGSAIRAVNGDGTDGMKGVDCDACLVAFDAWAQTKEPAQVEWNT